jgi:SAM-dependent methyltransferase
MLDFHNHWVKNMSLVAKFNGKAKSVFDIACGKGNDLIKYLNIGVKLVVGIDKSQDNIENPNDGAYARLLQSHQPASNKDADIIYIPMDFSQEIDNRYIQSIKDEKTKDIVELMWGNKTLPRLERYHNIANSTFDMVACQFAIHYFFENMGTLRAFLKNVDNVIKQGGYFIGTCLDGNMVNYEFERNKTALGESIGRRKDDRVLWDLRKMYKKFDKTPTKNVGLQIDVYMETINKRFSEYLVDFGLLEAELNALGIVPLTPQECKDLGVSNYTGTFKELFQEMSSSNNKNRVIDSALSMQQEEKDYSFMNRWFIFKKTNTPIEKQAPVKKVAKKIPAKVVKKEVK